MVEPGDFAGGVELLEMTVDGERVVLALIRDLEGDEHEDLVTAVEEGMRFRLPSPMPRRSSFRISSTIKL